jgi:hypothetical protein
MMNVPLYYRGKTWSFIPAGPHDTPRLTVESAWQVEIDYQMDRATLAGGPVREPFTASEFAVASGGTGMFGFRRVGEIARVAPMADKQPRK